MEKLVPKYQKASKGKIQLKGWYDTDSQSYIDIDGNSFPGGKPYVLNGRTYFRTNPFASELEIVDGKVYFPTKTIDRKNHPESFTHTLRRISSSGSRWLPGGYEYYPDNESIIYLTPRQKGVGGYNGRR